ncbi:MAG: hypothetical protein JW951_03430 [Lentisphaerae bacterium]|nr:hypothetical protein [Lentisphaerota bacterium]
MKTHVRSRCWLGAAACLAAAVLLAGCEDDGSPLGSGHDFGENNPDLYLAMGDSITAYGWPSILAGRAGKGVANYSQGGARTGSGAGAIGGLLGRYRPGYVLILYGSNDAINGADPDVSIGNLRAMVQAAKANRTIPVLGTLPPMDGVHSLYAGAARALSGRIRSLAGAEGAGLADVERAFGDGSAYLQPDGLHPTPAGSERIAAVFYDALH